MQKHGGRLSPEISHNPVNDIRYRHPSQRVILVIGSIGIDRLLTVQRYPIPDSKVRTTSYHEVGGGNAANTAAAMGKLCDARIFFEHSKNTDPTKDNGSLCVKYLGKVGRDAIGEQLIDELHESNVDTSSPLFCRGPEGSTTSFCTILVDETEHTRTCLFTPGTTGNLTLEDANDILTNNKVGMDKIFENVVHLHSDARLTEVSLALAKEAKVRNIPISVDCEKDRSSQALDELLEVCDILFTNASCLEAHIQRLTQEKEVEQGWCELSRPTIQTVGVVSALPQTTIDTMVKALTPSAYFARWRLPMKKEVIVTQGSMGSLCFRPISCQSASVDAATSSLQNDIFLRQSTTSTILSMSHVFCDKTVHVEVEYEVRSVGVLQNVEIVDTTGSGDAFIGGYLLSKVALNVNANECPIDPIRFQLLLGTFAAGKKLEGPGARTALPTGTQIDVDLGTDLEIATRTLEQRIDSFNDRK
jgi:sugar/nucleoside kinase (ribokinase family)